MAVGVAALAWLAMLVFPSVSVGHHAAARGLVWSNQGIVDRVAPTVSGIDVFVTCPFRDLCFGVDDLDTFGDLFSTRHPKSDVPWHDVGFRLSFPTQLTLPTCPSEHLCLIAAGSHVFVSRNPTGGRAAWRRSASLPYAVGQFVCPGVRLCLATNFSGEPVLVSTDPAAQRPSWRALGLRSGVGLRCPTTRFCALARANGDALTSSHPARGRGAWSTQHLPVRLFLSEIACPSARLCLVLDGAGNILSSRTPATGPWRTRPGPVNPTEGGDIWCRSTSLCFMNDLWGGHLFASSDPIGGPSTWHRTTFAPVGGLVSTACPSRGFCLATVTSGNPPGNPSASYEGWVFSASDPVHGPWTKQQRIDGYNPFTGVSCTRDGMCAGIDAPGDVLTSTDPSGGPSAWHGERIDPVDHLSAVSCASTRLCVAVDQNGGVLASTDPTAHAATWTRAEIDPGHSLSGIDCPSPPLCIAVDGTDRALYATRPAGGPGAWHQLLIAQHNGLTAVECASNTRCVLGGDKGDLFTSRDPTSAASWNEISLMGIRGLAISSIACPSRKLCALVDSRGDLIASQRPWGRATGWRIQVKAPGKPHHLRYVEVACASAHLCTAIVLARLCHESECEHYVQINASTDPAGGPGKWSFSGSNIGNTTGIACQLDTTTCVAVDDHGAVVTSR